MVRSGSDVTIGERLDAGANNFDLIRLLAAFSVMFSHSYFFLNDVAHEPFYRYLNEFDTGGGWGVATFFVISGFLVSRSVETRTTFEYLKARILRILPGLAVVVLLTILVVGPLATTLPVNLYFRDETTWRYLLTLLIFPIQYALPDVFEDRADSSVNAPLWTLPIEFSFYLLLPLARALDLMRKRSSVAVLVGAVLVALLTYKLGYSFSYPGPGIIPALHLFPVARFGLFFASGVFLYIHRDRIPLSPLIAAGCVALLACGWEGLTKVMIFHVTLPYLVIFAALYRVAPGSGALRRLGDLSYGLYIYAMPVQQLVIHYGGDRFNPVGLTATALPIVLALAWLSWTFVEKPALTLKDKATVIDKEPRL